MVNIIYAALLMHAQTEKTTSAKLFIYNEDSLKNKTIWRMKTSLQIKRSNIRRAKFAQDHNILRLIFYIGKHLCGIVHMTSPGLLDEV